MTMKTLTSLLLLLLLMTTVLAQKKIVTINALDGLGIGTSIDEARARLARIGAGGGRDTHEGGRKESWTLRETDFSSLAFKTNKAGKVVWVSAFVRPGREVSFAQLGDPANAATFTNSQAIWNVSSANGNYRVVAKGAEGKASVVYLLSLDLPEIK